jgi:hypothetical protein
MDGAHVTLNGINMMVLVVTAFIYDCVDFNGRFCYGRNW